MAETGRWLITNPNPVIYCVALIGKSLDNVVVQEGFKTYKEVKLFHRCGVRFTHWMEGTSLKGSQLADYPGKKAKIRHVPGFSYKSHTGICYSNCSILLKSVFSLTLKI